MVVLDFGVQQQMAIPQEMYTKPDNLFVAKFLGNPPINILEGKIENGKIIIGDNVVIGAKDVKDGIYDLGIRPEDFKFDINGFKVDTNDIDHTGRDTMIRFPMGDVIVRALVDSDSVYGKNSIKLSVKKDKIHIFEKETGHVVL